MFSWVKIMVIRFLIFFIFFVPNAWAGFDLDWFENIAGCSSCSSTLYEGETTELGTDFTLFTGTVYCAAIAPTNTGKPICAIRIFHGSTNSDTATAYLYSDSGGGSAPNALLETSSELENYATDNAGQAASLWARFIFTGTTDTTAAMHVCVQSATGNWLTERGGAGGDQHRDSGLTYPNANATFDVNGTSALRLNFVLEYCND